MCRGAGTLKQIRMSAWPSLVCDNDIDFGRTEEVLSRFSSCTFLYSFSLKVLFELLSSFEEDKENSKSSSQFSAWDLATCPFKGDNGVISSSLRRAPDMIGGQDILESVSGERARNWREIGLPMFFSFHYPVRAIADMVRLSAR